MNHFAFSDSLNTGKITADTNHQSMDGLTDTNTDTDTAKLKVMVKGIKASRKQTQNKEQLSEMTQLHPTDSLLGDLQSRTSNVSPTRHAE